VVKALSRRRGDYCKSRKGLRWQVNSAIGAVRLLVDEVNGNGSPIRKAFQEDRIEDALAERPPRRPVDSEVLREALAMSGILARRRRAGMAWSGFARSSACPSF